MRRKMTPTGNLTREEWLQLRRNGIGGSDASVIMGKNPYRSILQLWEEKTGKLPVTDNGNEFTYWGNVMEPIIRKEFMNRTGLKVRQKHAMIFHEEYPYLFADVDGIVTDERGRNVSLKQRQRVSIRLTSGKMVYPRNMYCRYSITWRYAA